jgi:hypothetical protein
MVDLVREEGGAMTESYNICRKHRLEDCEICAAPYGTCDWCGRVLGRKHYVKSNQFFDAKWCSRSARQLTWGLRRWSRG